MARMVGPQVPRGQGLYHHYTLVEYFAMVWLADERGAHARGGLYKEPGSIKYVMRIYFQVY